VDDIKLTSNNAVVAAYEKLVKMLHANDSAGAIAYVEGLSYDEPFHTKWKELLAIACTDGGAASGRRALVKRGAKLWRGLDPQNSWHIAYNLANAELALWEIAVREDGLLAAWEHDRRHLSEARALYEHVGRDASVRRTLRVQALTNGGNSYDMIGRDLDAIALYDEALTIDPDFAMALGNRGIALKHFAPYMGEHWRKVTAQAAADLTLALQNTESMECYGTPQSAEHFRTELEALPSHPAAPADAAGPFADAYLRWCHCHELFLHVWPQGLSEDTRYLDPLFVRGLRTPMGSEGLARLHNLIDAFNAAKQDYVAARYSMWLAEDPSSPIRSHSADMSARTLFIDTAQCTRYSVRTGMMVQAFAAATNVLDKIAGFVHLYLDTERVKDVSFGRMGRPDEKKSIDPQLQAAINAPEHNIGLLALLDLSRDLERDTALRREVSRRHSITHRFVVAHNIEVPESHDWIDRVEWLDLKEGAVHQLQTARAALIYLARVVDRHESASYTESPQFSVNVSMAPIDTGVVESL